MIKFIVIKDEKPSPRTLISCYNNSDGRLSFSGVTDDTGSVTMGEKPSDYVMFSDYVFNKGILVEVEPFDEQISEFFMFEDISGFPCFEINLDSFSILEHIK